MEKTWAAPERRAGSATRKRLLAATQTLIAEQGEARVSLRDITDAAEANVAAVSYHFGSKENLCRAAINAAIAEVAADHVRELAALPVAANVGEIANALVTSIVHRLLSLDARERCMLSLSAQAILAEPEATEYAQAANGVFELLADKLAIALPTVSVKEHRLRAQVAATLLHVIATGAFGDQLRASSTSQLKDSLVPILAGALAGWPGPKQE